MSQAHDSDTDKPVYAVPGIRLAAANAGIYATDRKDLVLIEAVASATTAAVFTRNRFVAAPVTVARDHIPGARTRYLLVNAGNANAGTGSTGITAARTTCEVLAGLAGCKTEEVVPFSTGVIGEDLPTGKICAALPDLLRSLDENNWHDSARGIMTTDTHPKLYTARLQVDGSTVTITGMAKGAGMIRPDMATMLAFIMTDAAVEKPALQDMLERCVTTTFNRICVDGDTSTNDACVLIATGQAGDNEIDASHPGHAALEQAIHTACLDLAQQIVRDAEGATKFVTIEVCGGRTEQECTDTAYLLATSPLVKTALYASDPNWGRILAVLGRTGIADLQVDDIAVYLNNTAIVTRGARDADYSEEQGRAQMQQDEITIRVELGRGGSSDRVWTCDLSHEYVTINAEYRT